MTAHVFPEVRFKASVEFRAPADANSVLRVHGDEGPAVGVDAGDTAEADLRGNSKNDGT